MTHTLPTAVIVELPEGAYRPIVHNDGDILYQEYPCVSYHMEKNFTLWKPIQSQSTYTHAKLMRDVSEEDARGLVDIVDFDQDENFIKNYYANYEDNPMPHYDTALESLHSLIRHLGYKNAAVVFKEK